MHIEVWETENDQGREAWVKVQSNEVVDLADIRKELSEDQAALLGDFEQTPCYFHPDMRTSTEHLASDYRYEDHWTFLETKVSRTRRMALDA